MQNIALNLIIIIVATLALTFAVDYIKTQHKPLLAFKKLPKWLQALNILCIVSLIMDIINFGSGIYITAYVIGPTIIIECIYAYLKKE